MRKLTNGHYGALAAAVALACGALNVQAQEEELTEAERAEVRQQTEELRQRTERLEAQTEALEEGSEAFAEEIGESTEGSVDAQDADDFDDDDLMARRQELVQMSQDALEQLQSENASAASLYEEAYGYAVFDTTKGGLIVTGAGGTGVAMPKTGGEETFMHLGQAGIGLGAGLENYKLVLLLEDEQTYEDFVSGQWDGSISAQAAAGEEGVAAEEQFIDGVKAYRMTDAGLMAQVDVSGIRFWASEDLNDLQVARADDAEDRDDARGSVEDAAENAGAELEDAAEDTGEALEDTAEEAGEALEETADEAEDAADEAGDALR